MGCPELEDLERHLAGELPDDRRQSVSTHVSGCSACAERLNEISNNLEALSGFKDALQSDEPRPAAPDRIGPFTVVREIARGGMGVVYLAEQDRPQRRVALKLLRSGVISADTLRRFELEAELLARLSHPGIATIYEAGVTTLTSAAATERVPYIAMEYVQGERLDRFVESRTLGIPERLDLLARIADAVHHAHVKGLVHRDLKPGNILVEPPDEAAGEGVATPKVLDFGIARIAGGDRLETSHTSTGQILGTIPYMSPEQLAGDPAAIDARSDVYALGVIAYETLTGELPYDVKRVSPAEAARVIRDDPPRSPARVDGRLRGDVETILLKALEKEPGRRYASAAELAADMRRFIRREPIQARPQSASYQVRRFAQRNRGLTAALGVLALVLVAAAVGGSLLALRATRAEERAQRQLEEARRQADKFEAVNRFLEEMLAAASPEDHPGRAEVTVREALGQGALELDAGSFSAQPAIELGVRTTIGNTYRALGEYATAREQLERAVELGRELYPDGHSDLAYALNKLARVVQALGDLDTAESLYRECLALRQQLSGERSEEAAAILNNLAHLLSERGDTTAALAMHEDALSLRRELFGETHVDLANSLNNIAVIHYTTGDLENAEKMLRESLEMDRALRGELHPNVASTINNLAAVVAGQGRLDEAEPLHRQALELQREIYGGGHPKLAESLLNLGLLLVGRGAPDEAEPLFAEALAIERRTRGPSHPAVANTLGNFARVFEARNQFDRAEELHREALAIRREVFGDDHVATLGSRYNLARVAMDRGHGERALREYSTLADDARRVLPAGSRPLFTILAGYGLCLFELDRRETARLVLGEAHGTGAALLPETDRRLGEVSAALNELDRGGH